MAFANYFISKKVRGLVLDWLVFLISPLSAQALEDDV